MTKPFLRWAGGKRWLAPALVPIVSERLSQGGVYCEPFLGSGAIFFAIQPAKALLSDLNEELIATYKQVATNHEEIEATLSLLRATKREYYRVRKRTAGTDVERAARLIYLNRTCWGGLYRENQQGHFNVPWGGGDRNHFGMLQERLLARAAKVLAKPEIKLRACDFQETLSAAGAGDVVYCDPTYRKVTREHFDRYGATVFNWKDQERLSNAAAIAANRGAVVIISNVPCSEVRNLYRGGAILELTRRKGLGLKGKAAKRFEHLLILDPLEDWRRWREHGKLIPPHSRVANTKAQYNNKAAYPMSASIINP